MEAKTLTPVQKDLLRMFSYDHSDAFANEIKSVLNKYFQSKIDEETDRLWDDGTLNQAALDAIRKEDLHSSSRRYGRAGSGY